MYLRTASSDAPPSARGSSSLIDGRTRSLRRAARRRRERPDPPQPTLRARARAPHVLTPTRSTPAPWLADSTRILRRVLPRRARSTLAVAAPRRARREVVTRAAVASQRALRANIPGRNRASRRLVERLGFIQKSLVLQATSSQGGANGEDGLLHREETIDPSSLPWPRTPARVLFVTKRPWPLGSPCSFTREHDPLGRLDDAACIAAGSLEGSLWVPSPARHVPVRSCTASSDGRRHASSRMLR